MRYEILNTFIHISIIFILQGMEKNMEWEVEVLQKELRSAEINA